MTRRVYIVVPGILSSTGDNLAWFVRLSEDVMRRNPETAPAGIEFRYTTGPLLRRIGQQERARQIAQLAENWDRSGFSVVLVGHSNGCDLITRAISLCGCKIEAAHLVAAACEADFEMNRLAAALRNDRLGEVICYVSKSDSAVGFFGRLSLAFRGLGLGYGTLGSDGPKNVPDGMLGERVHTIRRDTLDHTEWFSASNYDATFAAVTVAEKTAKE